MSLKCGVYVINDLDKGQVKCVSSLAGKAAVQRDWPLKDRLRALH